MSEAREVEATARCPQHALPERQHPWHNECPLCRMPARWDGSGPDGELTVTLVGRDALLYEVGRTWAEREAAWKPYFDYQRTLRVGQVTPKYTRLVNAYMAADKAREDACAALSAFDAAAKGETDGK